MSGKFPQNSADTFSPAISYFIKRHLFVNTTCITSPWVVLIYCREYNTCQSMFSIHQSRQWYFYLDFWKESWIFIVGAIRLWRLADVLLHSMLNTRAGSCNCVSIFSNIRHRLSLRTFPSVWSWNYKWGEKEEETIVQFWTFLLLFLPNS